MVYIKRFDCKRLVLFIVIASLASIIFIISASAAVSLFTNETDPTQLNDGIYNIVNRQTGQYLDVFDLIYDKEGKTYLSNKSGQNGQDFYVKRQDDNTYIIYPQSENGIYSLSYEFDIMEGEFITKKEEISNQSKFTIVPVINEETNITYYTIKPSCMIDTQFALGISSTRSNYGYSLAGLSLENDSSKQQWQFIKVSSATLEMEGSYINLRLGDSRDIYAALTPEHLIGNMVWESSNSEVASVDENGVVYALSEGTSTITVSCGTKKVSTTVKVTDLYAYTWYSQHNMYSGGWYASPLTNVTFNNRLFFSHGYRSAADWMDEGCKLSSEAMVLHNMGAKLTNGYDFRTDKENELDADPYTVALANTGTKGVTRSLTTWNNPVSVSHYLINPRFLVDGNTVVTKEYHGNSLKHIKELLDKHPEGVVVGMYNGYEDTTHYVVFTECLNPDDKNGNYEFRICDSAASIPELGDNVPFNQSISYKSLGYRYSSIFTYSVYEVVEPVEPSESVEK